MSVPIQNSGLTPSHFKYTIFLSLVPIFILGGTGDQRFAMLQEHRIEVIMYNKFGEVELKTGERMEVGVVTAPDTPHAEEMKQFLGHKPGNYKWHIERCVTEVLDALETRFYVGKLNGAVITNIMTVEYQGVGILGHVFTLPQQRRKGAAKGVMAYQMEDFRQRSGSALYLGTGYNSHPYYIYQSFGFESVFPESGFMKYHVNEDFEGTLFRFRTCGAKICRMARLAESHGVIRYCRMGYVTKSEVGGLRGHES